MVTAREWCALPLVSRSPAPSDALFQVNKVAVEALKLLAGRRARVLGVCGPRATSKRMFLQTLLNSPEPVKNDDGDVLLWLWLPQSDAKTSDDCRVVITSDERDEETKAERRARLVLLLLLSSALFYSDDGEVDAAAIERLDWLADVPNALRIKPTMDDQSVVSDFHRHAPAFVWVAQNFKVKWLTGTDGVKMSPTEYLERGLAEESGYSDAVGARNSLRMYLTAFFSVRECVALSRATEGTVPSAPVADLPARDALRTQFVDAVDKVYGSFLADKSFTQLSVKQLMGRELDASQLAMVVEAYVAAMNAGQLPAIQTASNLLLEQSISDAFDAANEAYRTAFPANDDVENAAATPRDLLSSHWRGVQAATAKLLVARAAIFADDKSQTSALAKQFDERAEKWQQEVEGEMRERVDADTALLVTNYAKILEEVLPRNLDEHMAGRLVDTPRESFSDGLLESLTHYKTDLMMALASYKSRGDGPQLYAALENALLQEVSPSVQRFGTQVLAQLARHIASWQAEKQQLERELDAARAQDEQTTLSTTGQKRLYEEQLAQSTQQLSEMRSVLQGELNGKKAELERLTSDLTTMNLKHDIRVKNAEGDLEWARRRTEEMEASIRERQQRQLELQLQMQQGADELLTTERGFHKEERSLLSQQKELMNKVVQLQRELVQKKTSHVQQVFTLENENAKQVDDARAAHAEFARKLRAQAKSDLAMLRLAHQRKKTAAQTQLAELNEQVANLRARLTTCDVNEDAAKKVSAASSSTSGRDLLRAFSMSLTAAVADSGKTDAKPEVSTTKEASDANGEATASGAEPSAAEAPKPRDTSMCAQS